MPPADSLSTSMPASLTLLDYALLLGALGLGLGVIGVLVMRRLSRQYRQVEALARELRQLQAALNVVLAGATGQDRRAGHFDQRLQQMQRIQADLLRRLNDLDENQRTARPYDQAIRLVRQGASVERLVEELGLSQSEAELLIRLHGTK
jgi:hypothetical protein